MADNHGTEGAEEVEIGSVNVVPDVAGDSIPLPGNDVSFVRNQESENLTPAGLLSSAKKKWLSFGDGLTGSIDYVVYLLMTGVWIDLDFEEQKARCYRANEGPTELETSCDLQKEITVRRYEDSLKRIDTVRQKGQILLGLTTFAFPLVLKPLVETANSITARVISLVGVLSAFAVVGLLLHLFGVRQRAVLMHPTGDQDNLALFLVNSYIRASHYNDLVGNYQVDVYRASSRYFFLAFGTGVILTLSALIPINSPSSIAGNEIPSVKKAPEGAALLESHQSHDNKNGIARDFFQMDSTTESDAGVKDVGDLGEEDLTAEIDPNSDAK